MIKGHVKTWNRIKGWGFIESEDGEDYFVNISNIKRGIKLYEGLKVKFDITHGQRGEEAENVSIA